MRATRSRSCLLFVFIMLCVSACATVKKDLVGLERADGFAPLLNKAVAKSVLLEQYDEWKGTSYRYGGLSKDGIDCSGFIHLTFLSKFNIRLPRQSIVQGEVGYDIPTELLQPGDLVFFKIGSGTNHVGIYIDNGKFMHVSTRRGVMMSGLSETYWRRRFWKSRRISL